MEKHTGMAKKLGDTYGPTPEEIAAAKAAEEAATKADSASPSNVTASRWQRALPQVLDEARAAAALESTLRFANESSSRLLNEATPREVEAGLSDLEKLLEQANPSVVSKANVAAAAAKAAEEAAAAKVAEEKAVQEEVAKATEEKAKAEEEKMKRKADRKAKKAATRGAAESGLVQEAAIAAGGPADRGPDLAVRSPAPRFVSYVSSQPTTPPFISYATSEPPTRSFTDAAQTVNTMGRYASAMEPTVYLPIQPPLGVSRPEKPTTPKVAGKAASTRVDGVSERSVKSARSTHTDRLNHPLSGRDAGPSSLLDC